MIIFVNDVYCKGEEQMGFFDFIKSNSQNTSINKCSRFINAEKRIKNYGKDAYMQLHTSRLCDFCKKFDKKIYSVLKSNKKHPNIYDSLPANMFSGKCPECGKSISYDIFIHGINVK